MRQPATEPNHADAPPVRSPATDRARWVARQVPRTGRADAPAEPVELRTWGPRFAATGAHFPARQAQRSSGIPRAFPTRGEELRFPSLPPKQMGAPTNAAAVGQRHAGAENQAPVRAALPALPQPGERVAVLRSDLAPGRRMPYAASPNSHRLWAAAGPTVSFPRQASKAFAAWDRQQALKRRAAHSNPDPARSKVALSRVSNRLRVMVASPPPVPQDSRPREPRNRRAANPNPSPA